MIPERLPIYAIVTKSHMELLGKWFLKTLPFDCCAVIHPMDAEPVSFRDAHWHTIFIEKIKLILSAIKNHAGSIIVASDVDVQFFRPIAAEIRGLMEGYDILFQNAMPQNEPSLSNLCAGFSAIRCSDAAKTFFEEGLRRVVEKNHGSYDDQLAYQDMCSSGATARVGLLPTTYWTYGRIWFPEMPIELPENIAIQHAAWIVGNGGKMLQLEMVREMVEKRR